jgi:hypothetical protein
VTEAKQADWTWAARGDWLVIALAVGIGAASVAQGVWLAVPGMALLVYARATRLRRRHRSPTASVVCGFEEP